MIKDKLVVHLIKTYNIRRNYFCVYGRICVKSTDRYDATNKTVTFFIWIETYPTAL